MFFFFNDTATTEIYTLSLHDALPISALRSLPSSIVRRHRRVSLRSRSVLDQESDSRDRHHLRRRLAHRRRAHAAEDRKSTRLNSSHLVISYAVFCLQKKTDKHTLCPL